MQSEKRAPVNRFDAVLVPGGGLLDDGAPPPWVANRLERALEVAGGAAPILTLSAGTTHKPLPRDSQGQVIFESVAAARFLRERGQPPELLFTETASYDTIGNAYFARVIHADAAGWRRLMVITSAFHMARTEAIFRWVFALTPVAPPYELSFAVAPDVGMPAEVLAARRARESASLLALQPLLRRLGSLASVHCWLFTEHAAYAPGRPDRSTGEELGTALASY